MFLAVAASLAQVQPHGSIIWTNASFGDMFTDNALALPNGDVLLVSHDSSSMACISHVSGSALWSVLLPNGRAGQCEKGMCLYQMAVGPRYGTVAGDGSTPVVVIAYGSGYPLGEQQFLVVDTMTGEVVVPDQPLPDSTIPGGPIIYITFADGVLLLVSRYGKVAKAVTVPDLHVLFDVPYVFHAAAITTPLVVSGNTVDQSENPLLGNRLRPALALAHIASGPLALIGGRPNHGSSPGYLPGGLLAIDITKNKVLWTVDNMTPHSIFVDADVGVAVVGLEAPCIDWFTKSLCDTGYLTGFRGYSLTHGSVLWDSTTTSNVTFSDKIGIMGATAGPRACETACGQPCGLITVTPLGPNGPSNTSFAMNTSTGKLVSQLPPRPSDHYAVDTVNGVEYTLEGPTNLIASSCGSDGFDQRVLWSKLLPDHPTCHDYYAPSELWQRIVVGAAKKGTTKQPMVYVGGACCTMYGPRTPMGTPCIAWSSDVAAIRAPA